MPGLGIGPAEIGLVLLIVLVLFGPKQLPKLGKMFGKTMKEVRSGMEGIGEDEPKTEETKVAEAPEKSDEE